METTKTPNFSNISGYDEVKEELLTIFKWYKNRNFINNKDISLPTGILFHGRPGNGKTLFIKEYIRAFNAPTYVINGKKNQIEEIQDAFKKARKEKFAIIVIDELDMLISGNKEVERVLQSELDGINKKGSVLVLATTNSLQDIGEPLKRQGRFDRVLRISFPNIDERASLFRYYFNKLKISVKDIDINHLCNACTALSCAEIKSIVNDAYLRSNGHVTTSAVEDSLRRLQYGDFIRTNPLKYKDYTCAIHEAGHVIMALKYPNDFKIYSVQFERGGGSTRTYPVNQNFKCEKIINMIAKIQMALSGSIAEQIFFKHHDTGVINDLEKVYLYSGDIVNKIGDNYFKSYVPTYSDEYNRKDTIQHKLENEKKIHRQIRKQSKITKHYLKKHKKEIKIIADALYNKGILTYHEICNLLGIEDKKNII